jgi:HPt (histidine-containing phosphotransfer) domain-containing protein
MNDFVSKPIDGGDLNRALTKWLPPEKVTFAEAEEKTVSSSGPASLWDELEKIEGLDVAAGISHVGGNAEGYLKALKMYCEGFEEYLAAIRSAVEKEDWADYAIRLHAQKGVMAALGHEKLSGWAARLEKAGKAGDGQTCKAETEDICKALSAFRDALGETSLFAGDEAEKQPVEAAFLAEKLALLREACKGLDGTVSDEIAGELAKVSFPPDAGVEEGLKVICRLAESYDFEAALEKIGEVAGLVS